MYIYHISSIKRRDVYFLARASTVTFKQEKCLLEDGVYLLQVLFPCFNVSRCRFDIFSREQHLQ